MDFSNKILVWQNFGVTRHQDPWCSGHMAENPLAKLLSSLHVLISQTLVGYFCGVCVEAAIFCWLLSNSTRPEVNGWTVVFCFFMRGRSYTVIYAQKGRKSMFVLAGVQSVNGLQCRLVQFAVHISSPSQSGGGRRGNPGLSAVGLSRLQDSPAPPKGVAESSQLPIVAIQRFGCSPKRVAGSKSLVRENKWPKEPFADHMYIYLHARV